MWKLRGPPAAEVQTSEVEEGEQEEEGGDGRSGGAVPPDDDVEEEEEEEGEEADPAYLPPEDLERGAANISDADSDEDDEDEDEDEDVVVPEKVVDPETLWTAVKSFAARDVNGLPDVRKAIDGLWAKGVRPEEPECDFERSGFLMRFPDLRSLAYSITCRLGWDWGGPCSEMTQHIWDTRVLLYRDDVLSSNCWLALKGLPGWGPENGVKFSSIILDPPFGLNKHSKKCTKHWDEHKWTADDVLTVYRGIEEAGFLKPAHCLVVYCMDGDIGSLTDTFSEAYGRDRKMYKGHETYIVDRDGAAALRSGVSTPGHKQPIVLLKFGSSESFKLDNNSLGGRTMFNVPVLRNSSKCGRLDLDARIKDDYGEVVNETQKTVEETRLLVRHTSKRGEWILSLCNGTGTGLVAATLEGRNSVGVDYDAYQVQWARNRMLALGIAEECLRTSLAEGRNTAHWSTKELERRASLATLPDQEVRAPTLARLLVAAFLAHHASHDSTRWGNRALPLYMVEALV